MRRWAVRLLVRLSDFQRQVLAVCLAAIGPRAAYAVQAVLARCLYWLSEPLREQSETQCAAALGGSHNAPAIRRIAQRAFVHRAWNLTDLLLAQRLIRAQTHQRYGGRIPEPYLSQLRAAQAQRQPVILITAYYGPFDLLPLFLGYNGIRAGVVYRPHGSPAFDAYRRRVRAGSGCELIPVGQTVLRLPQILEDGGTVALLSDHQAGRHGVPVTFLGRPTVVARSVGLLAARFGASVAVAGIRRRTEAFRFEMLVTDLFGPSAWGDADDAVAYITRRYVAALDRLVLGDPGQYLWAHPRWGAELARRAAGEPQSSLVVSAIAGRVDDRGDERKRAVGDAPRTASLGGLNEGHSHQERDAHGGPAT